MYDRFVVECRSNGNRVILWQQPLTRTMKKKFQLETIAYVVVVTWLSIKDGAYENANSTKESTERVGSRETVVCMLVPISRVHTDWRSGKKRSRRI